MGCKAKIYDVWEKDKESDPYNQPQIYKANKDGDVYHNAIINDVGTAINVTGCGDNYSVVAYEHGPDKNLGQEAGVFSDGKWGLHRLYGGVSGVTIEKVPYDSKAVGKQDNVWWMGNVLDKNNSGTWTFFHNNDIEITQGNWKPPCPAGGRMYPLKQHTEYFGHHSYGGRYACAYDEDPVKIRQVRAAIPDSDPRLPMYNDLITNICSKDRNITFELPDDKTCITWNKDKSLGRKYCSAGDNIISKTNICNVENLGTGLYDEILTNHCKKGANITTGQCGKLNDNVRKSIYEDFCKGNPTNEKCSCYNVTRFDQVCKNNPSAAGCVRANTIYNTFVELGGDPGAAKLMMPCGEPCVGDKYQPDGWDANCKTSINNCIQNITAGNVDGSRISAACNITAPASASPPPSPTPPSPTPSEPAKPDLGFDDPFFDDDDDEEEEGNEEEGNEGESGDQPNNTDVGKVAEEEQGFFEKYKMFIIGFIILIVIGGIWAWFDDDSNNNI